VPVAVAVAAHVDMLPFRVRTTTEPCLEWAENCQR
jgi:hypothetical protein